MQRSIQQDTALTRPSESRNSSSAYKKSPQRGTRQSRLCNVLRHLGVWLQTRQANKLPPGATIIRPGNTAEISCPNCLDVFSINLGVSHENVQVNEVGHFAGYPSVHELDHIRGNGFWLRVAIRSASSGVVMDLSKMLGISTNWNLCRKFDLLSKSRMMRMKSDRSCLACFGSSKSMARAKPTFPFGTLGTRVLAQTTDTRIAEAIR